MRRVSCVHEDEVVHVILSRRWPDACEPELRAHVERCVTCSEALFVARLLREERGSALQEARVPAAGQIWWRAAIRARMEAAHTVSRPVSWVQGLAAALAIGLVCAVLTALSSPLWTALQWAGAYVSAAAAQGAGVAAYLAPLLQRSVPIVGALAIFAVLAPIALLLVLSED